MTPTMSPLEGVAVVEVRLTASARRPGVVNTLGGPVGRGGGAMAIDDIRNTATEQYWEELRQRWGALLSYRYIGRRFSGMNSGVVDNTVMLRHDMRNAAGGVLVAALSITSPGGGGGI